MDDINSSFSILSDGGGVVFSKGDVILLGCWLLWSKSYAMTSLIISPLSSSLNLTECSLVSSGDNDIFLQKRVFPASD